MERRSDLKSLYILRENIRKLLLVRREEQKALAEWCGHDKSWMNKFLNEGRGIRVGDFDKIASFFGVEPYQLFQPGISAITERRTSTDRRTGQERRVGHAGRQFAMLASEHSKLGGARGARPTLRPAEAAALEQLVADFYARLPATRAQAGRQTASPRDDQPVAPQRRRSAGGSHDPKP